MNHLSVDLLFLIYTQIATSFGEFDEKTGKFAGPSLGVIALTEAIITAVGGWSYEHGISVPLVGHVAFLVCAIGQTKLEPG